MPESNARISRVHGSWRVRVPGYAPKFFADCDWGGKHYSLLAARDWRDIHWNGVDRSQKLTPRQRAAIRRSKEHYEIIAKRYGISPNYVHQLRRQEDE